MERTGDGAFRVPQLARVLDGDRSPQALANLVAYYLNVMQKRDRRYDYLTASGTLKGWLLRQYAALGLQDARPADRSWTKVRLTLAILEKEYPVHCLEETLRNCGIDPKETYRAFQKYVQRAYEAEEV